MSLGPPLGRLQPVSGQALARLRLIERSSTLSLELDQAVHWVRVWLVDYSYESSEVQFEYSR